jgi:hypothetical protein
MLRDAVKAKDLRAVPCTFSMQAEPAGAPPSYPKSSARCCGLAPSAIRILICGSLEFGLGTAMRHREILGARFDQIDWVRRRLHIPKAKAGAREQPLTAALVEILK